MASAGTVTPRRPQQQESSGASAFGAVFVALGVIIGFAAFFVSFLLAPIVIIAIGYVLLVASERASKGNRPEAPEVGNTNLDRSARIDRDREVRRRALRNGNGNGPVMEPQVTPIQRQTAA